MTFASLRAKHILTPRRKENADAGITTVRWGVEATGGVFLLQTSGVTAQHERWLRPQPPFHRWHVRADVVWQVDVVVLPDDEDVAFRQHHRG